MSNTPCVFSETGSASPSQEPMISPYVVGGFVLIIFVVFCVAFLYCFTLFCALCPMLSLSLDCLFVIAILILSNVYFQHRELIKNKYNCLINQAAIKKYILIISYSMYFSYRVTRTDVIFDSPCLMVYDFILRLN